MPTPITNTFWRLISLLKASDDVDNDFTIHRWFRLRSSSYCGACRASFAVGKCAQHGQNAIDSCARSTRPCVQKRDQSAQIHMGKNCICGEFLRNLIQVENADVCFVERRGSRRRSWKTCSRAWIFRRKSIHTYIFQLSSLNTSVQIKIIDKDLQTNDDDRSQPPAKRQKKAKSGKKAPKTIADVLQPWHKWVFCVLWSNVILLEKSSKSLDEQLQLKTKHLRNVLREMGWFSFCFVVIFIFYFLFAYFCFLFLQRCNKKIKLRRAFMAFATYASTSLWHGTNSCHR